MKRLIPPLVVLAGFGAFIWLFRLSKAYEMPEKTPPPLPTADEIQEAAKGFKYEIGKYGGSLNDFIDNEMKDLNLAISTDAQTSSVMGSLVFELLLDRDPLTLDWEPLLAAEVPTHSEDPEGLIWIVKLRRDVKWHDGAKFTADDVVFSFNDITLNETIPASGRPALQMMVKEEATGKTVKKNVLVEKVDEFTVRFTFPQRYALYQNLINGTYMYPKHILKSHVDDGTFASTWNIATPPEQVIGTGPYMPAEYVSGERFIEKRNPNYWKKDEAGNRLPYLDRIVFNIIQNPETMKNRFLVGEIDYLDVRSIDLGEIIRKSAGGKFDAVPMGPRAGWSYICLNQNPRARPDGRPYVKPHKSGWFRDVRFRRAVAHCLDKDSIKWLVSDGFAAANWSPYTPKYTKYYTSNVKTYPYDLDASRQLLDEMGLKDRNGDGWREDEQGNPAEFILTTVADQPTLVTMVTIIEQDLKKVGVKLVPEFIQFNLLVRRISQDWDWEAIILSYTAGPEPLLGKTIWKSGEPRRVWNPRMPAGSAENRDWEKRIDQIFDQAYTDWDPIEKRFRWETDVKLAHEWQQICAENLPHIYLMYGIQVYAFSKRIRNRRSTLYSLYDIERLFEDPEFVR
ncbi:MAG: peptide/nickel transport system substrate-binding [Planctomycetota bacterium]|nr:MAG: peptide/nickel transport system substrate-binding [Planctomycetota bacterium]